MRFIRTAREVVELYNYEVWNKRRIDLAHELLGDTVVRHGVDNVVTLGHAEAVHRVADAWNGFSHINFTLLTVVADDDGEHVAIVYQCDMTGHDGTEDHIASIEVYRVVDGRIVAVYNNPHQRGIWQ